MAALTKSPAHGRRSSSGSGSLRPVLPFELDEGTAVVDDDDDEYPPAALQTRRPKAPIVEYGSDDAEGSPDGGGEVMASQFSTLAVSGSQDVGKCTCLLRVRSNTTYAVDRVCTCHVAHVRVYT